MQQIPSCLHIVPLQGSSGERGQNGPPGKPGQRGADVSEFIILLAH